MAEIARIEPLEVQKRQNSGQKLWLVCAYDDEARCTQLKIGKSMTLNQFESLSPLPSKDDEIIFY